MSERLRVYDLARELGLTNKELLELLAKEGVEAKSHSSTLEHEYAELIRDHVIKERSGGKPPAGAKREAEQDAAKAATVPDETKTVVAEAEPVQVQVQVQEEEEDEDDEDEDETAANEIHLKPPITVRDLAKAMGRKPNEIIGQLMTMNVFATINQVVEADVVEKICTRFGLEFVRERRERAPKPEKVVSEPVADVVKTEEKVSAVRKPTVGHASRPPVVAFLGHVDHGKTSLLDAIRKTHVTKGESGGITQHIGASVLELDGYSITFLDTPGHEAFTAMRARGANATDIVVLVVAADDGVMPQTKEAINHAKAAGVPIVVAMNKIDLPNANRDKVMLELQQNDVAPEEWGGQVGVVPVSAITGVGIDNLLERIHLEAEIMELKANPSLPCDGLIIEAQLETGMGPTANVLVRNGTLHVGDIMLCGQYYGKVRALIDQTGRRVKSAGPSTPVKVLGLSGVPEAGEAITVIQSEREAKMVADQQARKTRTGELETTRHATLDDLFRQITEEARTQLQLIIKADVRGTLEAVIDSLRKLETPKVRLDIIHQGVGEITENDVLLASASDAIIVGFHVRAMPGVNRVAKQESVEIRLYSIIYELLEDMREAMRGRLQPESREQHLGWAEIRQVFKITKTGKICGCLVVEGAVRIGASARVLREGEVIYNGQIQTLKHFKDDVREVRAGQECGIRLDNFEDFEVDDRVEAFAVEKFAAEL